MKNLLFIAILVIAATSILNAQEYKVGDQVCVFFGSMNDKITVQLGESGNPGDPIKINEGHKPWAQWYPTEPFTDYYGNEHMEIYLKDIAYDGKCPDSKSEVVKEYKIGDQVCMFLSENKYKITVQLGGPRNPGNPGDPIKINERQSPWDLYRYAKWCYTEPFTDMDGDEHMAIWLKDIVYEGKCPEPKPEVEKPTIEDTSDVNIIQETAKGTGEDPKVEGSKLSESEMESKFEMNEKTWWNIKEISPGTILVVNRPYQTEDGGHFIFQDDGNLVLYKGLEVGKSTFLWGSYNNLQAPLYGKKCMLTENGAFAMYNAEGDEIWKSEEAGSSCFLNVTTENGGQIQLMDQTWNLKVVLK